MKNCATSSRSFVLAAIEGVPLGSAAKWFNAVLLGARLWRQQGSVLFSVATGMLWLFCAWDKVCEQDRPSGVLFPTRNPALFD